MGNELGFTLALKDDPSFNRAINNAENGLGKIRTAGIAATRELEELHRALAGGPNATGKLALPEVQRSLPMFKLAQGADDTLGKTKELRAEIRELGSAVPGLASLGQYAFNPWLLSIGGLILAYKELEDQQKLIRDRVLDLAEYAARSAELRFNALAEATREVAAATADFRVQLSHANDAADPAQEAATRQLSLAHATIAADRIIARNQLELNNLYTDQAAALGQISTLQAAITKNQDAAIYGRGETATANRADEKEISNLETLLTQEQRRAELAANLARQARADSEDPLKAAKNLDAEIKLREGTLARSKKEMVDAQADYASRGIGGLHDGRHDTILHAAMEATRLGYEAELTTLQTLTERRADLGLAQKDPAAFLAEQQSRAIAAAQKVHQVEVELDQKRALYQQQAADRAIQQSQQEAITNQRNLLALSGFIGQNRPDFGATSVEKMGAVFGGGGPTLLADHARATADNTARMTAQLQEILHTLQTGGGGFTNRN